MFILNIYRFASYRAELFVNIIRRGYFSEFFRCSDTVFYYCVGTYTIKKSARAECALQGFFVKFRTVHILDCFNKLDTCGKHHAQENEDENERRSEVSLQKHQSADDAEMQAKRDQMSDLVQLLSDRRQMIGKGADEKDLCKFRGLNADRKE